MEQPEALAKVLRQFSGRFGPAHPKPCMERLRPTVRIDPTRPARVPPLPQPSSKLIPHATIRVAGSIENAVAGRMLE
jgi:hypothetical protein